MKMLCYGQIVVVLLSSIAINGGSYASSQLITPIGSYHGLTKGRHGNFLFNAMDTYVGRSLQLYGEWSEQELVLFSKFVKPGQTVLDVGANMGAFTIPLAKMVGADGTVHAFEPQRVLSQMVAANAVLNELHNVVVHHKAVGNETEPLHVPRILYDRDANYGAVSIHPQENNWQSVGLVEQVPQLRLDDEFYVDGAVCPSFVKIDVEGMELLALQGGRNLLRECKPVLYVENNCVKDSPHILRFIRDAFDNIYTCHWDVHPYFNPNNYAGNTDSVFSDNAYAINIICYPTDMDVSAVEELQPMTRIDMEHDKFELSQYELRFIGREDVVLNQLGTKEMCVR